MVTTEKIHLLHQLLLIGKFDYFLLTQDEFYAVKRCIISSNLNKTIDGVNAKTDSEQSEKEIYVNRERKREGKVKEHYTTHDRENNKCVLTSHCMKVDNDGYRA